MPVELKVPSVGESVTEVQIGQWKKRAGDPVQRDESVVEIESDKATVDLLAPAAGILSQMLKHSGEKALVGEVIGYLHDGADGVAPPPAQAAETTVSVEKKRGQTAIGPVQKTDSSSAPGAASSLPAITPEDTSHTASSDAAEPIVMPAAERILAEHGVSPSQVQGSGPGGRILKEDALRFIETYSAAAGVVPTPTSSPPVKASSPAPASPSLSAPSHPTSPKPPVPISPAAALAARQAAPAERTDLQLPPPPREHAARQEEFVVMSPIRRRIAERLVEAQQTAALLTTFNEIDMTEVLALRAKFKDAYLERYGIKLGFMSFFVKAVVDALRQYPQVNAEVREPHIVYKNYYDIGIAVGGGKGLVVPILRNAEFLSFAEIETTIADFGRRAAENKIKLEELQGGTFTISNGGVYGSLLSTPIVNPPQSGILGLHAIQDRPVARAGQVVIRPMMYVALTYDHRIVDGREAVSFLKRVKEGLEDPSRLLIEV